MLKTKNICMFHCLYVDNDCLPRLRSSLFILLFCWWFPFPPLPDGFARLEWFLINSVGFTQSIVLQLLQQRSCRILVGSHHINVETLAGSVELPGSRNEMGYQEVMIVMVFMSRIVYVDSFTRPGPSLRRLLEMSAPSPQSPAARL